MIVKFLSIFRVHGIQDGFSEGMLVQYPTNVVLSQYKKDKWYLDFDKEWNRTMIHADSAEFVAASNKNKGKIKIAMLDSGIDYSSNINVVEDEDFVEDYDDMSILFSDLSGHGTAIAGVLGSSSTVSSESFTYSNEYMNIVMNEKIDGVNPYVDIYSARILDDNNETTVSRLVEGIQWAIEKDVNIINISCGVDSGSSKLHTAIKEAYNKGILIIAAAGDSSGVKYPAKYAEVMAVGAVKCNGKLSAESPTGAEIEVVAPGEDVTSYGPFGMVTNFSGTSIAAPQVTALASVLWQQDTSRDASFIRGLIKATARPLGSKLKFGEGLIDCSYALSQYETYANGVQKASIDSTFSETEGNESNVETNNSEIIKYEEEVVKGYWGGKYHTKMAGELLVLKKGAIWPDDKKSSLSGMTDNPLFHGYYKANYIKAYKKITWIAHKMNKNGKFPDSDNKLTKKIIADVKKATINKKGFEKAKCTTKEKKALFIYGIAMHTTADIFAHSASAVRWTKIDQSKKKKKKNVSIKKLKKQWKKLTHGKRQANGKFSKNLNFADNTTYIPNRINSARSVCSSILNTCITKKTKGSIIVFKNVKYYASKGTALKYKSKSKKKKYLKNSYGIFNLSTYLKPTEAKGKNEKKLTKVVNSVANSIVKNIFAEW